MSRKEAISYIELCDELNTKCTELNNIKQLPLTPTDFSYTTNIEINNYYEKHSKIHELMIKQEKILISGIILKKDIFLSAISVTSSVRRKINLFDDILLNSKNGNNENRKIENKNNGNGIYGNGNNGNSDSSKGLSSERKNYFGFDFRSHLIFNSNKEKNKIENKEKNEDKNAEKSNDNNNNNNKNNLNLPVVYNENNENENN